MAFLELRTKPVLRVVEMLPTKFYTHEELAEIRRQVDFYSWSEDGYYIKEWVVRLNEPSTEEALSDPGVVGDEWKTPEEMSDIYSIPIYARELSKL